ncbi:MAG: Fe-S cluster assembly protein SufD [Parvibaculales bacterium]
MPEAVTLSALQHAAAERAQSLGLPTRRLENWHYTDLQKLLPATSVDAPSGELDLPALFAPLDPVRLVFVDGALQAMPDTLPEGLHIVKMSDADVERFDTDSNDGLLATNMAHFTDGVTVRVSGHLERPVEFVWACSSADKAAYGRVMLNIEKDAGLTVLETHQGTGFSHLAFEAVLAEDAGLEIIKTHLAEDSQAGITHSQCQLAKGARLKTVLVGLQAGLARHETNIMFNGAHAHAEIASVLLGSESQHMDVTSCLDHRVADTTSETVARTVLDQQARGVFQGKVIVRNDAQRVDANQKSDALMLSRNAEMNAKPELEIYADDVACAHGSAIGEIDRDAVFFLRSRGLGLKEARQLLISGFMAEIVERISDENIREVVSGLVAAQLLRMEERT